MEKMSLESTNYDVESAGKLDERMEKGKKDAVFFHVLGWIFTIVATVWMYVFGCSDPAQMTYFLGMPIWISGAIVIYLIMFVVGMIYVAKRKEFPLTARITKDGGEEK